MRFIPFGIPPPFPVRHKGECPVQKYRLKGVGSEGRIQLSYLLIESGVRNPQYDTGSNSLTAIKFLVRRNLYI